MSREGTGARTGADAEGVRLQLKSPDSRVSLSGPLGRVRRLVPGQRVSGNVSATRYSGSAHVIVTAQSRTSDARVRVLLRPGAKHAPSLLWRAIGIGILGVFFVPAVLVALWPRRRATQRAGR